MPFAEAAGGPSSQRVASLAKYYGVAVVFPYFELGADGKVYDSLDVFDMTGQNVLHYRKVNLAAGESAFLTPGNEIGPVVQLTTNNGTYMVSACRARGRRCLESMSSRTVVRIAARECCDTGPADRRAHLLRRVLP